MFVSINVIFYIFPKMRIDSHLWLLAPCFWGCYNAGETSICPSVTENPYWWCKICPESSQELWLVNIVIIIYCLSYCCEWQTLKAKGYTKVKCKHDKSTTNYPLFVEYILLWKNNLSFGAAHSQENSNLYHSRRGEFCIRSQECSTVSSFSPPFPPSYNAPGTHFSRTDCFFLSTNWQWESRMAVNRPWKRACFFP